MFTQMNFVLIENGSEEVYKICTISMKSLIFIDAEAIIIIIIS